jgi:hypothetical protein
MMPYILHVALILAGCLVFYKLLLQKETFFRLNRWILLCCLVISFGLPFVQVPQQWSFRQANTAVEPLTVTTTDYDQPVPTVQESVQHPPATVVQSASINWHTIIKWTGWLYWFGVMAFAVNFLLQVVALLYRSYTLPVIKDGRFRIVELSGDKAPCSFGNNIFINPEKYDWDTYNQIILHEKEHIRQGHTLDLLIAELVLIVQWFNPFAWLYRKELESNLEFLTDDQLLLYPEVEREAYQMSLLKVSAPHFPLSITTNYNQSLLKKRVAMMNAKRSNVHTSWKYFFLLPVLVLFVCLLNEPMVMAQTTDKNDKADNKSKRKNEGIPTEGVWFAVIKNDKVTFQFKSEDDDFSMNSTSFSLSEIKDLPRDKNGIFTITRDAGTVQFTGKFEGEQGMGRYEFQPSASYAETMRAAGIEFNDDENQMVFFMVIVQKGYPQMLKDNGYTKFEKNDLIPLAALKVDAAYIQSLKKNGYSNISVHDLIPLKSLNIDGAYIDEIRKAGYPNVTPHQLITFKSQGINGKYIADIQSAAKASDQKSKKGKENKSDKENKDEDEIAVDVKVSADDLVAIKAMNISTDYIASLKAAGLDNLSNHDLIAMKSQDIGPDYIQKLREAGYTNVGAHDLIAMKSQDIDMEYLKSFELVGYSKVGVHDAISMKSMNITPDYIKSFQSAGFKNISLHDAVALKSQDITPAFIKEYQALGLEVSLHDVISAKATGTTPAFIKSMKEKGHDLKSIHKYIQLKTIVD